jgi:hypothetical protein
MTKRKMTPIVQFMLPVLLLLGSIAGSITKLLAFTSQTSLSPPGYSYRQKYCRHHSRPNFSDYQRSSVVAALSKSGGIGDAEGKGEDSVKTRDLLIDLPTPTLLIELSLAENALNNTSMSLDDFLQHRVAIANNKDDDDDASSDANTMAALDGCIFVHTSVLDTSVRDRINRDLGSGKSPVIGSVDACSQQHVPGGAFLGIGLSNHHVGGYYWARGMGIGASLEAHGVAFRDTATAAALSSKTDAPNGGGELYWEKWGSDPTTNNAGSSVSRGATTDESSNSNDGKRSEWADFLVHGDTIQLIPYNATRVLRESAFQRLVGVRRVGRPLGADPIVERLWKRESSSEENGRSNHDSWTPL